MNRALERVVYVSIKY